MLETGLTMYNTEISKFNHYKIYDIIHNLEIPTLVPILDRCNNY